MNSMRKVFSLLIAAVALAAFALPAAAQKVYTLNLSPTSLTAGSSAPLTATMNNISPDTGNSSVKSFKLFAPTGGGITITAPASGSNVPLGGGYTATIQNNGTSIYVSNINLPLKPFGPQLVLNMTVNVACAATGGNWSTQGQVWTGTGFTGQTFAQQNPSFLAPTINPGCAFFTFTTVPNPSSVSSPSGTVTAKFTNTSTGVNLNSAQVTAPAGLTINPGPASTSTNGGTVSVSGQVVTVTGLTTPVTPGNSLTLILSVSTTPSCTGAPAAAWNSAQASSGGTPTGSTQLTFQGSYPTTSVTAQSCSMTISASPSNVAAGDPFSFTINLINGPGNASVKLSSTGGCGFSAEGNTYSVTGGTLTINGLTFSTPGTCTINSDATAAGYGTATVQNFQVFSGSLNCSDALDTQNPAGVGSTDPGFASGKRGLNNKDGSPCTLVNYTFDNQVQANNQVSLVWDTGVQPNASFSYCVTWKPYFVDSSTGLPPVKNVQLTWTGGNNVPSGFVDGRFCLDDSLPVSYGTLAAATNGTQTTICVTQNATPLPDYPFAVFVDTERMTVLNNTGSGCSSGTPFTVVRGEGGTTPSTHSMTFSDPSSTPKPMMSNPLPLDGSSKQMQMCISEDHFISVPQGDPDCTVVPGQLQGCVQRTTCVFDLGDGGVKLP